ILLASQARGQQPVHHIGILLNTKYPEANQAWLEGLSERGYVVGRNLQIEYRYSQARTEQIPALVAELVALGPEVIVASGEQNVLAVHAAAPTIPLVFINVADPGRARARREPGASGWQRDRAGNIGTRRLRREAAPVPKGGHSASIADRRVDQSYEPYS